MNPETETTTLSINTTSETVLPAHNEEVCLKERLLDYQRFQEWEHQIDLKESFKKERQIKREKNRLALEIAQKKATDFKDFQRRDRLGLLTPEELETRRLKKEQRHQNYLNKRK